MTLTGYYTRSGLSLVPNKEKIKTYLNIRIAHGQTYRIEMQD